MIFAHNLFSTRKIPFHTFVFPIHTHCHSHYYFTSTKKTIHKFRFSLFLPFHTFVSLFFSPLFVYCHIFSIHYFHVRLNFFFGVFLYILFIHGGGGGCCCYSFFFNLGTLNVSLSFFSIFYLSIRHHLLYQCFSPLCLFLFLRLFLH